MNIIWRGKNWFQISSSPRKNELVSIAINPCLKNLDKRTSKLGVDILLFTHNCDEKKQEIKNLRAFLIKEPGEYEKKGVFIQGIPGGEVIYTIKSEGIVLCHLGNLSQGELSSRQLEEIGRVDILMISIGESNILNLKQTLKIINQVEPRIIIPMDHQPSLKEGKKQLSEFLKAMGAKDVEPQNKLSIKKKDLPEDGMKIRALNF